MGVFEEADCIGELATSSVDCTEGRVAYPACRNPVMGKPPLRKCWDDRVVFVDVSRYAFCKALRLSPSSPGT